MFPLHHLVVVGGRGNGGRGEFGCYFHSPEEWDEEEKQLKTEANSLNFSGLPVSVLGNGDDNLPREGVTANLNEIIHVRCLAQFLTHGSVPHKCFPVALK